MIAGATLTESFLVETSLADAAIAMARGYEGYFVPIHEDPGGLARRIRSDHVDPLESRVFRAGGQPAGVLLVARRGRVSRIAALGFAPELRGAGHGQAALGAAISAARARADEAVLLEVITENAPALALYEKLGFRPRRRLVGYARPAAPSPTSAELAPLSLGTAVRRLTAWSDEDLPWQLAPESFAGATAPLQALALYDDAVALLDPTAHPVRLVAFAVAPAARRQGIGRRLLAALAARFAGQGLAISAIVPEGLAEGLFRDTGWDRTPLSQWEMRLPLEP